MPEFTTNPPSIRYIEKLSNLSIIGSAIPDLWVNAVSTDDTFKGNRKYLFIVNARVRGSETSKSFSWRTVQSHDGSELTYRMTREPMNTGYEHSYNAATVFVPEVDTTVSFQQMTNQSGTPTTVHCYMVALDITELKEGTDYFFQEDTTGMPNPVTHTNIAAVRNRYILEAVDLSHPTDKMQEKAGTWMLIGGSQIDVEDTAADSYGMQLSNSIGQPGGFGYAEDQVQFMQEEGEDVIDIASNFLMMPIEVSSSDYNHRFNLHTWDSVGSNPSNGYMRSYLIGLRLGIFKDENSEFDPTDYSDDTSWEQTVKTWNVRHSQAGKYFVLCCGVFDAASTTASFETNLDTSSDHDIFVLDGVNAGRANDFKDELPFVVLGLIDVDKSQIQDYTWRFNKYTSSVRGFQTTGYVAFSLAYNYEEFYDKLETVKIGESRRRRTSPTIPTIG